MPGMNSGLSPATRRWSPRQVCPAPPGGGCPHRNRVPLAHLGDGTDLAAHCARRVRPAGAGRGAARSAGAAEARGRRLLRVGFGLLWIFDGILQAQPKMAGGLAAQVIQPTAAASPAWVQHLVNWGGTAWSFHPIQARAASVWIQVGIGAWLIVAARVPGPGSPGRPRRLGPDRLGVRGVVRRDLRARPELADRAPGAVLIYAVAGALIALPEGAWRGRLGRLLLTGLGLSSSAWPCFRPGRAAVSGRAEWTASGSLSGMVQSMSGTSQPHFLSALLSRSARSLQAMASGSTWSW